MAIDLIEHNELGALSKSRLGNGFIDDNYSYLIHSVDRNDIPNYVDIDAEKNRQNELNANILEDARKHVEEKRLIRKQNRDKTKSKWQLDPSKIKDCVYVKGMIDKIVAEASKRYKERTEGGNFNDDYYYENILPLKDLIQNEYSKAIQNCGTEDDATDLITDILAKRKADKDKEEADAKAKAEDIAKAKGIPANVLKDITNTQEPLTDNKKLFIGAGIIILVTYILTR